MSPTSFRIPALTRWLPVAAALVVLKVTLGVLLEYRHYLPPDFNADFLLGRDAYFWGAYATAFYVHLLAGPLSLVLGTVLLSARFRRFAPLWHRRLGRLQAVNVLLVLVPSGLWMARYAITGAVAGWGLALLALATATSIAAGWRAAMQRRLDVHRLWMWRTYLLLCSAVVLRLATGLATLLGFDAPWLYPLLTWTSWLVPLVLFEGLHWLGHDNRAAHFVPEKASSAVS